MQQAYVVTGSMMDGRTLTLDETLPCLAGKVRVVVEIIGTEVKADFPSFMDQLREEQRKRGHVPRTAEEVDEYLRQERASWDD